MGELHGDQGDVVAGIKKLKEQAGKDIRVIGSGELAQTLIEHNLVDEYNLMIHPIVLAMGKHLFRGDTPPTRLKLVESTTTSTGVLLLTYVPEETS